MNNLIPIVRQQGLSIYGKIVGPGGKLGQYEFHDQYGRVYEYATYSEAEKGYTAALQQMNKR